MAHPKLPEETAFSPQGVASGWDSTPADELADDETCTDCHGSGFNEVMERRCNCNPVSPEEQIAANLEAIRQCQIEMAKNNEALCSALAALRQPPSDAIREAVIEECAKALEDDAKLCDCAAHGSHECACGAWDDYKTITSQRAVEIVRALAQEPGNG